MWLITLKERKDDGAYAVLDMYGDKVLFLLEEKYDASRYAMMLEDEEVYKKPMEVIEVDAELAINTCKRYNYKYSIITPDDLVIPPKNDNISED